MGFRREGKSVIKSFRSKALKRLVEKGDRSKVNPEHVNKLVLIMNALSSAASLDDANFPGAQLHPLKGFGEGRYAISVSGNWRVTFRFENGHAEDVDYLDYH